VLARDIQQKFETKFDSLEDVIKRLEDSQNGLRNQMENMIMQNDNNRKFWEDANDYQKNRLDQFENDLCDAQENAKQDIMLLTSSNRNIMEKFFDKINYGMNEKIEKVLEKIDRLETRIDQIENSNRHRQLQIDGPTLITGVKSKGIEILLQLSGVILMLLSIVQQMISPFTRSLSRTIASLLTIVLSLLLYRYHYKHA
jgi:Mg2+ and Co2+ transporter CorA